VFHCYSYKSDTYWLPVKSPKAILLCCWSAISLFVNCGSQNVPVVSGTSSDELMRTGSMSSRAAVNGRDQLPQASAECGCS
jgi:hypothetical protein